MIILNESGVPKRAISNSKIKDKIIRAMLTKHISYFIIIARYEVLSVKLRQINVNLYISLISWGSPWEWIKSTHSKERIQDFLQEGVVGNTFLQFLLLLWKKTWYWKKKWSIGDTSLPYCLCGWIYLITPPPPNRPFLTQDSDGSRISRMGAPTYLDQYFQKLHENNKMEFLYQFMGLNF